MESGDSFMAKYQEIEVARQAYDLYQKKDNRERRRRLDFVVSECSFKDGTLYVTYRKPFNLFVEGVEIKKMVGLTLRNTELFA